MAMGSFDSKRLLCGIAVYLLSSQVIADKSPVDILRQASNTSSTDIIVKGANVSEIFLLKANPHELIKHFSNLSPGQAMGALAELKQLSKDYISSDESLHTVLFVFDKKLDIGTTVTTQHQISRPLQSKPIPYEFYYSINEAQDIRPLIVLNESRVKGNGGSITYSLFIDDEPIISKKVGIK